MLWRQVPEKKKSKRDRLFEKAVAYIENNQLKEGQSVDSLLSLFTQLPSEDQQGLLADFVRRYHAYKNAKTGSFKPNAKYYAVREVEESNLEHQFAGCVAFFSYLVSDATGYHPLVATFVGFFAGGMLGWGLREYDQWSAERHWTAIEERGEELINGIARRI